MLINAAGHHPVISLCGVSPELQNQIISATVMSHLDDTLLDNIHTVQSSLHLQATPSHPSIRPVSQRRNSRHTSVWVRHEYFSIQPFLPRHCDVKDIRYIPYSVSSIHPHKPVYHETRSVATHLSVS